MRLSRYFVPTLRDVPQQAVVASHRLMLRAGLIRQESAGIYAWLPLGFRALRKIEDIICAEQERIGYVRMLMPTVQAADVWRESGRYEGYGPEMLRFQDRHGRDFLYGPTNEEEITALVRHYVKTGKSLPLCLYHVQWKFRDEARPRFGVMRGREFLMKDAYSFARDEAQAHRLYEDVFRCYMRTFHRLGVRAVAVRAPTGVIGGDMSHEFHILAETGEGVIYYDKAYDDEDVSSLSAESVARLRHLYAAEEALHEESSCPVPLEDVRCMRGIEVGHIFFFGTKYSHAMGLCLRDGEESFYPQMGSYGIGVSRLVAAVIEAHHDDKGIIWPCAVAPFHVGLLNMRVGDSVSEALCERVYAQLGARHVDVLYDDRDRRSGVKFHDMELMGMPWQIIVGKLAGEGRVELKNRRDGLVLACDVEEACGRVVSMMEDVVSL
ncbi:MAG: proline--tRNA ligase [Alphaproteobacteria bacterium GM7ARS4]|nr:proline--tRNA ligase [Alphaproteobacteria bacterium GM7ARS4]